MWQNLFFVAFLGFRVALSCKSNEQPTIATYSDPEPNTDEQICCCGEVRPPKCGKNEVYDDCKVNNCRPKLCSELGYKLDCNKKCKPGCTCKNGYVRNIKGVCIPKKYCTTCGGDKRAQSGCGTNCGKRCAEAYGKPLPCPKICKFNACDCRDGFYYDDKEKTCVKKDDCKICTGQYEYYEECIQKCGSQNCTDVGKTYKCPNRKPGECDSSGCLCNPGYLRNATGACVPKRECPPPKCPPGQVWSKCPSIPCKGDNCPESRYSRQDCPIGIVCSQPRCVCAINRKKDQYGNCILIKKCPPFPCGKNEKYKACPSDCEMDKCSDYTNPQECRPNKTLLRCRPTCICKESYYRDDEGNCIPGWQCPIDTTT